MCMPSSLGQFQEYSSAHFYFNSTNTVSGQQLLRELSLSPSCLCRQVVEERTALPTTTKVLLPRIALCSVLVITSSLKHLLPAKRYWKPCGFLQNLPNGHLLAEKLLDVAHSKVSPKLSATWSRLLRLPVMVTGACTSYWCKRCFTFVEPFFPSLAEQGKIQQGLRIMSGPYNVENIYHPFPLALLSQMKT